MKFQLTLNIDESHAAQSACILPISVGRDVHAGEQLAATIAEINNKKFKKCYVMVACKLQRHTLQIKDPSIDAAVAEQQAIQNGKQWFDDNKAILEQLSMEYEVKYWSDFLDGPEYAKKSQIIQQLYSAEDKAFHTAVDRASVQFLNAYAKQEGITSFDLVSSSHLAKDYILEECGVLLLWRDLADAKYLIYLTKNSPSHNQIMSCLSNTANGLVKDNKDGLRFLDFNMRNVKDTNKAGKEKARKTSLSPPRENKPTADASSAVLSRHRADSGDSAESSGSASSGAAAPEVAEDRTNSYVSADATVLHAARRALAIHKQKRAGNVDPAFLCTLAELATPDRAAANADTPSSSVDQPAASSQLPASFKHH